VERFSDEESQAAEERLGSLMDRLHRVRKRKRAYSGQGAKADAIEHLWREERRRRRGG
jgi:hypothetical protein